MIDLALHRQARCQRGITPVIVRRKREHGSGLVATRWVMERMLSWLHNFLRIRWERRTKIHEAFISLAEALISFCASTSRS